MGHVTDKLTDCELSELRQSEHRKLMRVLVHVDQLLSTRTKRSPSPFRVTPPDDEL